MAISTFSLPVTGETAVILEALEGVNTELDGRSESEYFSGSSIMVCLHCGKPMQINHMDGPKECCLNELSNVDSTKIVKCPCGNGSLHYKCFTAFSGGIYLIINLVAKHVYIVMPNNKCEKKFYSPYYQKIKAMAFHVSFAILHKMAKNA